MLIRLLHDNVDALSTCTDRPLPKDAPVSRL
jgi:hypothetical protein